MVELIKTPVKKQTRHAGKPSLLAQHGITSLAAPTQDDLRKLKTLSPEVRKALWDEGIRHAMDQPTRKITKEDIRARALDRLGIDG